jgi:hypothetical protein
MRPAARLKREAERRDFKTTDFAAWTVQSNHKPLEVMMSRTLKPLRTLAAFALAAAALLAWPVIASAQSVSGAASAVQANVLGMKTVLAGTGPLADASDLRDASQDTGSIFALGGADILHAAAGSSVSTWDPSDYVASEASLADLGLTVAGNSISAAFVMARALAPVSGSPAGTSEIDGLTINGVPVDVTGQPNQIVGLLGGRVIINEQSPSSTGTTVNALHVILDGVADLVFASASAGVNPAGPSSTPPPILPLSPLF